MEKYQLQLIYTLVLIIVLVLFKLFVNRIVIKRILAQNFDENRKLIINKLLNILIVIILIAVGASIWGLHHSQLILFATSLLTVLGVAFFAQWSHLSNVTSGIIIFFDSSIKIGDYITILDKEFDIKGKVEDITTLFIKIRTDKGELISIPNNTVLQKPIQIENEEAEYGADE